MFWGLDDTSNEKKGPRGEKQENRKFSLVSCGWALCLAPPLWNGAQEDSRTLKACYKIFIIRKRTKLRLNKQRSLRTNHFALAKFAAYFRLSAFLDLNQRYTTTSK